MSRLVVDSVNLDIEMFTLCMVFDVFFLLLVNMFCVSLLEREFVAFCAIFYRKMTPLPSLIVFLC